MTDSILETPVTWGDLQRVAASLESECAAATELADPDSKERARIFDVVASCIRDNIRAASAEKEEVRVGKDWLTGRPFEIPAKTGRLPQAQTGVASAEKEAVRERDCPDCGGDGDDHRPSGTPGIRYSSGPCPSCLGTGYRPAQIGSDDLVGDDLDRRCAPGVCVSAERMRQIVMLERQVAAKDAEITRLRALEQPVGDDEVRRVLKLVQDVRRGFPDYDPNTYSVQYRLDKAADLIERLSHKVETLTRERDEAQAAEIGLRAMAGGALDANKVIAARAETLAKIIEAIKSSAEIEP